MNSGPAAISAHAASLAAYRHLESRTKGTGSFSRKGLRPFLEKVPVPDTNAIMQPTMKRWQLKLFTRLHVLLHRLTFGRAFNSLAGDEVCFVTMKGAKTARTITLPLMYVPYRDGILLVASQGGAPHNPAWYFNLVKTPTSRSVIGEKS